MERQKAALHNLGCKVNAYETEAMQQQLEQLGYEIVPFTEKADIYIINTCTVTNIADRKSRQMLHKAKKQNPQAIVIAAGCYVQTAQKACEVDEAIDIIIGNNKKKELGKILAEYQKENSGSRKAVLNINQTKEYEDISINRAENHTRAYMKIQDGCNQFCTYCIIPYARGRVRSRRLESVKEEAQKLAENGFREIVLTGIHLSSYGIDIGSDLLEAIFTIHQIPQIERIRLGSLEPNIITEEFVRNIKALPKVCPHFHLSLQSGCDTVLERMNRKYTAGEYYEKCELLRRYYKDPAITTDVIVGFPGETEEEFESTKKFLQKIGFFEMHIFKYSKRANTKAAVMPGQIAEEVKAERSNQLLKLEKEMSFSYRKKRIGKIEKILVEEKILIEGESYQIGHTEEYIKVAIKTPENLVNQIVEARIEEVQKEDILLGKKIESE